MTNTTEAQALAALGLPPYLAFRFSAETIEAQQAFAQHFAAVVKQLEHKNAVPTVPALRDLIIPLNMLEHDYIGKALQDIIHHQFNLASFAATESAGETTYAIPSDAADEVLGVLHGVVDFLESLRTYARGALAEAGPDLVHKEFLQKVLDGGGPHVDALGEVVDVVNDLVEEKEDEEEKEEPEEKEEGPAEEYEEVL